MSFDESKSISLSFIAYCWLLLGIALGFGGMIIPGILALICYLILSRVFPRFPFELRVVSSISTAKALFIVTAILLNLDKPIPGKFWEAIVVGIFSLLMLATQNRIFAVIMCGYFGCLLIATVGNLVRSHSHVKGLHAQLANDLIYSIFLFLLVRWLWKEQPH